MSVALPSETDVAARAVALFRRRRFVEAAGLFAELGGSGSAVAVLAAARAWFLARDLDAAREAARRAGRLDPTLVGVPLLLSRIAAANGNRAGCVTHLRRAVGLRPDSAGLRVRLGRCLLEAGRLDEALAAGREALAADPDGVSACLLVADSHLARGNPTLARLAVARLARQRPELSGLRPFVASSGEAFVPAPVVVAPALRPRHRPPSLLDHLVIIRACMLRGLSIRHAGNPFWLPLELARPTCVVVAHWVMFAVLHKPMPGQIPIPLFVLAGFSVWFAFNYAAMGAANGANNPVGALAWPGVTSMHLRLSRALWPLLVNLTFCLLATVPFRIVRPDLPVPALPLTCLVFAVAGLGGIGYGLLAERLGSIVPAFGIVEKLLSWLLFITCGLYFVVYHTTPLLAGFLVYNPLLHLIDFERHAFDPGYPVALVDLRYPIVVAGGVLALGLACCRVWPVRQAGVQ